MNSSVPSGAVATPAREWWRPNETLARYLQWSLGILAAGQLLLIGFESALPYVRWHRILEEQLDGHPLTAQRLQAHMWDGVNRVPTYLVGVVALGVTVVLVIWSYRSATNARALGRTGERLQPIWAILGWLIPVASLFLPYLVFQDLWRSSDPGTERGDAWRSLPGSARIRVWWAIHIAGSVLAEGAIILAVSGVWRTSPTETVLAISHVVAAVGWVLLIFLVRDITARQAAQQAADPAPTSPQVVPTALATAADDSPGWKADPSRRFDHRYWDGKAWTEHVSTAGQPTTAPVTPPDWYPDPTHRFHWRYWTGHAWTEHASRDGQLFVDPLPSPRGDEPEPGSSSGDPPLPA